MSTTIINCRSFMNSQISTSVNIWQQIKLSPASHMVALATGLAVAVVLTLVICGCKRWLNRRSRSSWQPVPTPCSPVYGLPLSMNSPLAPVARENQNLPQFYSKIPMIPERYSSLPYPLNYKNSFVRVDTI